MGYTISIFSNHKTPNYMISSLDRWRYSSFRKKLATIPTEFIGDDQDGIALCRVAITYFFFNKTTESCGFSTCSVS